MIHLSYIIGILAAIIMVLVAIQWGRYPALADRLGFASSLTSVILAVLAIIYAFVSSASISSSVGEIESAAASLSASTAKFETSLVELNDEIRRVRGDVAEVARRMEGLPWSVKIQPDHLAKKCAAKSLPAGGGAAGDQGFPVAGVRPSSCP